jgi:hypothetical protein
MKTFLTRQQIIDTLSSLPDLPVVIERDTDQLMSTKIESIEIREVVKGADYNGQGEFYPSRLYPNRISEKVIWIS